MCVRTDATSVPSTLGTLTAGIFDVDGVLLASPHERAWREALEEPADRTRFTTAMYQARVAGRPRMAGAMAALSALGVADAGGRAAAYAERKQARLEALIDCGGFSAFPDALRFVRTIASLGLHMAVASSSKNADRMLRMIQLGAGETLHDAFIVNVCGRDLRRGKPDPEIFLTAAAELGAHPSACFVVEDATAGVEAARAGRMRSIGIARLGDASALAAAGADLVVQSLDQVDAAGIGSGRLLRREA